jgi:hypothetical protein
MKKQFNTYKVTVTDTFAGEANYNWAHRYELKASSEERALRKALRLSGYNPGVMGTGSCKARVAAVIAVLDY